MKMRNPWGNFEWDGSWGDDSQEWKEVSMNLKKELKYKQTNDGIFFIQFEDFIKYFSVFSKTIRFDALKDKHNTVMCDLKNGSELFYSFEIQHSIDLTKETFAFFYSRAGDSITR